MTEQQKQLLLKQAVAKHFKRKMLIQHVGDIFQPITKINHKPTKTFGTGGWALGSMIMNAHNVANKFVSMQTITD